MYNSYADALESYTIAEESDKSSFDTKVSIGMGLVATAILGGKAIHDYVKYKQEKKRNAEQAKAYKEELTKFFDEKYDSINRKYQSMYNDISKAVKSLNNGKIAKEIENAIKIDYKDDPDLISSLCDDVYPKMFNMTETSLPLPKSLPRTDCVEFTIDNIVSNSLYSYISPYLKTIADAISIKYKIHISCDSNYAVLSFNPRELDN